MEKVKPSYYAIIPAKVRYDENLNNGQKLLYGEITALTNKKGYCFAGNKYFARLYNCDPNTISRWISNLVKEGYLEVEIVKNSEDSKRKIYLLDNSRLDRKKHIDADLDYNDYIDVGC